MTQIDNWKLNTSNPGKKAEFQLLFSKRGQGVSFTEIDLKEIVADHLTVAIHKASQLEEKTLIEDTTLDVEDAEVGINVRWLLDHLTNYIGHKAYWTVLLAYRTGDKIRVYRGMVEGEIVAPRGNDGFGFDPVFLPKGASKTLAENKPDHLNARNKAVDALIKDHPYCVQTMISDWNGPWQA